MTAGRLKRESDEFMKSRGWKRERMEMFQNIGDARKFVKFNMLLEKRSEPPSEIGFTIKKLWEKYYVSIWRRK